MWKTEHQNLKIVTNINLIDSKVRHQHRYGLQRLKHESDSDVGDLKLVPTICYDDFISEISWTHLFFVIYFICYQEWESW